MKISYFLNKENNNLDLIRILLSCLVIIGHAPILNGASNLWVDPIGNFFTFTYSGALAVKLFFFISGLVVTNSFLTNRSPVYFIISRFFRLIPSLLFVLVVTVFIFGPILTNLSLGEYFSSLDGLRYIRNNLIFSTDYSLPGIFSDNLYKTAVNGSLWSLNYEVGCYIILLAAFLLLTDKNKYYLNIPIAIIIIDTLLPSRIIFNWLGTNPEGYLLPASFAFGVLFAVNADKIQIKLNTVIASFLIYYTFNVTAFAQLIFIFASCTLVIYLASNKFIRKLKPKYDISYGIYLWGFLIQQALYHFLGHIYVGYHCLLALLVSILLALITNVIIEKPFIKIGKHTNKVVQRWFSTIKRQDE